MCRFHRKQQLVYQIYHNIRHVLGENTVFVYLKHQRCGGRGEIETLGSVGFWVIFGHVAFDDDGFGSALFSYQKHSLKHMKKTRVDSREGDHLSLCTANQSAGSTGKVLMTNKVAVHLNKPHSEKSIMQHCMVSLSRTYTRKYNIQSIECFVRSREFYNMIYNCILIYKDTDNIKMVLVLVAEPVLDRCSVRFLWKPCVYIVQGIE